MKKIRYFAVPAVILASLLLAAFPASAAVATKASHVSFAVYLRSGPSPSRTSPGVIPAAAPIIIYCQTQTTDPVPTSVAGYGTSWLWDLVSANVNGQFTRGFITDLAPNNTPYQVRDNSLPDCANLGGLPLDLWCPQMAGNTHVTLANRNDAYGWRCTSNTNPLLSIPLDDVQMTRACAWYYGTSGDRYLTFRAYYSQRNDAYSWRCMVSGG